MKRLLPSLAVVVALTAGRVSAQGIDWENLFGELEVDQAAVSNFLAQAAARFGVDEEQLHEARRELQRQLEELWSEEISEPVAPLRPLELPSLPPPALLPVTPPFWKRAPDLATWPARARTLVPKLKPIFTAAGVPPELVWVAEIESGFNPQARSRAGAVGLFQLMPATARLLDLSLWPRDERLDPEKNARASARYLRYLYARFRDWPLVLAAYNGGEGRVRRLLGNRPRTFADIADSLPTETRLYVPRIQSAILEREGLLLSELPVAPLR